MTGTRITDFEAVAPFQESPKTECEHESDGSMLLSDPPQYRCKKCGAAYRIGNELPSASLRVNLQKLYTQADLDAAVQKEREACAMICEFRRTPGTGSVAILNGAADAIRARSQYD